jgi:plasmid replication initiation protein
LSAKSYFLSPFVAFTKVPPWCLITFAIMQDEIIKTTHVRRNLDTQLAVQSNELIHARYEMTALQKKILLLLISKIQQDDVDFKPYRIRARDFLETAELKSTQIYGKLKIATEGLLSKVFHIKRSTGMLQITILSSAEYFEGRGVMELCFDPKLKPYLLQLKEQFTILPLKQVLGLRSVYAIRLYEMLQQFKSTGFFITKVDDFKYKLNLEDKYRSYNLFKRNVILQAQKELSTTDMAFTFEEIKEGKKVDRIKFKLLPMQDIPLNDELHALQAKLILDLGLTEAQSKKIVLRVPPRQIHKTVFDIKSTDRAGKIKTNISAYAMGVFAAKYDL